MDAVVGGFGARLQGRIGDLRELQWKHRTPRILSQPVSLPERQRVGARNDPSYKARAREACERDGWRCRYCGVRLIGFGFSNRRPKGLVIRNAARPAQVDHVVPRSVGGTHELTNLVASCVQCNASKGRKCCPAALWTTRWVSWGRRVDARPPRR